MTFPLIYFEPHIIERRGLNEGGSYFVFGSGFYCLRVVDAKHIQRREPKLNK